MRRAANPGAARGTAVLLLAALLLGLASLGAAAAPVEWSGRSSGTWARLYVDGQKATGGVEAALGSGAARMELSGSGSGARYVGSLQGTAWDAGRALPVSGSWEATTGAPSGVLRATLRGSFGSRLIAVPLRQAALNPLYCAWSRGAVTRKPVGGAVAPLARDGAVAVGDVIQTGADGRAVVVLGDSSVVMMQENTRLEIPAVSENNGRIQKARVGAGKIWFAVKKVQAGEKFEVETDEAVAAVRGTEFLVEVDENEGTALTTAEGQVAVADRGRSSFVTPVAAGMRWRLPRVRAAAPAPGPVVTEQRPVPGPRPPTKAGPRPGGTFGHVPQASANPRPGTFGRLNRPERQDLGPLVRKWSPLLRMADQAWPYRRLAKPDFWEDRYRKSPQRQRPFRRGAGGGRGAGPGDEGATGRPGHRRGAVRGQRRGGGE